MEGMGEEKLYFLLLKSLKRKKKPSLGRSVSTNFVADCRVTSGSPSAPICQSLFDDILEDRDHFWISITFARTLMSSLKLAGPGIVRNTVAVR